MKSAPTAGSKRWDRERGLSLGILSMRMSFKSCEKKLQHYKAVKAFLSQFLLACILTNKMRITMRKDILGVLMSFKVQTVAPCPRPFIPLCNEYDIWGHCPFGRPINTQAFTLWLISWNVASVYPQYFHSSWCYAGLWSASVHPVAKQAHIMMLPPTCIPAGIIFSDAWRVLTPVLTPNCNDGHYDWPQNTTGHVCVPTSRLHAGFGAMAFSCCVFTLDL